MSHYLSLLAYYFLVLGKGIYIPFTVYDVLLFEILHVQLLEKPFCFLISAIDDNKCQ